MTDLIKEARELASKATDGPWVNGIYQSIVSKFSKICNTDTDANAAFIARSRTLVPELADALEKAEAEVERLIMANSDLDDKYASTIMLRDSGYAYKDKEIAEAIDRAEKAEAELAAYKEANPPRAHGEVAWKTRQVWYANHVVENGVIVDNGKYHEDKTPYCSECGKLLDDTFMNFCPSCGCDMRKEPT